MRERERSFFWCRACRQPLYATSTVTDTSARNWEIDHQQPGSCTRSHVLPLTGIAEGPEELPAAGLVLRHFGP
ncbi:hypothetical protein [Streptomyces sp. NBC_01264]|uniref:hypothetical protein n=1 Tax=Streptomyces sp. NBC_01264 TaxID=2903804 RepID=UPI002259AC40|nr:hypothetical protein [Streptomyces sp. NBC_01264]MCX4782729.1 hypothetical protein [Streptomyces sp. NBC_01264]